MRDPACSLLEECTLYTAHVTCTCVMLAMAALTMCLIRVPVSDMDQQAHSAGLLHAFSAKVLMLGDWPN
jgi:hypothetical protein